MSFFALYQEVRATRLSPKQFDAMTSLEEQHIFVLRHVARQKQLLEGTRLRLPHSKLAGRVLHRFCKLDRTGRGKLSDPTPHITSQKPDSSSSRASGSSRTQDVMIIRKRQRAKKQ